MWLCDVDGAPVELTRSEFDLLLAIMQGARRVISKDALALELRGDYDRHRLRLRLRPAGGRGAHGQPAPQAQRPGRSPRFIETVRGVGYRLAEAQRR